MSSVIRQETAVFLIFVLHGAALTCLYDILRALRRCLRHGLVILSLEDFLFWLLAGFLTFYLAFQESDGSIRGYAAAGILIGFLLYHFTLSPLAVKGLSCLFGLILRAAVFMKHLLRTVVRLARCVSRTAIHFTGRCFRCVICPVGRFLRTVTRPLRRNLSTPVKKICRFCKKKAVLKKTCRFHKKRIEFTRKNDYNKKSNCADRSSFEKNHRGVKSKRGK